MGDRANIFLVDTNVEAEKPVTGIYLYTHWAGYEWPERLRKALVAGSVLWGDEPYVQRIIISRVFADIHESVTGGGVSTWLGDHSYPIIICNTVDNYVAFAPEGREGFPVAWEHKMSFGDYVAQKEARYPS